jgi:hypothetical protein
MHGRVHTTHSPIADAPFRPLIADIQGMTRRADLDRFRANLRAELDGAALYRAIAERSAIQGGATFFSSSLERRPSTPRTGATSFARRASPSRASG